MLWRRFKKPLPPSCGIRQRLAVRDADIVLSSVKPQAYRPFGWRYRAYCSTQSNWCCPLRLVFHWIYVKTFAKSVPVIRDYAEHAGLVGSGAAGMTRGRWAKPVQ